MGLADVQLLIRSALAAVAVAKATDVLLRGDPAIWAVGWIVALVLLRSPRVGAAAIMLMGFGSSLLLEPSNHSTLIGWVGLIVAANHLEALRVLAATVYLFASAHKIIGGVFLTGAAFASRAADWVMVPLELLALGGLVAQLWLTWAVVRRHWTAFPLAVALHVGIVATMSTEPAHWLRLGAFNGLMVLIVWVTARRRNGR